jgi:hypothetical protein
VGGSSSYRQADPFGSQLRQDWTGYNTGKGTAEQKAYRDWLRMKQEEYLGAGSQMGFRDWYGEPIRQKRMTQKERLKQTGMKARRAYGGGVYVGKGNEWKYYDSLDDWYNGLTAPGVTAPGKGPPPQAPAPYQPPPAQNPPNGGPGYDPGPGVPDPAQNQARGGVYAPTRGMRYGSTGY